MIPPCAQNVLQSFGSADLVTRRTLIPAVARQSEVVRPAMPVPMTRTGQWSRLLRAGTAGLNQKDQTKNQERQTRNQKPETRNQNQRMIALATLSSGFWFLVSGLIFQAAG